MSEAAAPLILTLALDGESFAHLDRLRRAHFPAERNQVPAHLTLFHALPGGELARIRREVAGACAAQPGFILRATGLRSLGRGVAIAFASPELVQLRQSLAREWADWLTPQDCARIAPHVTVQNKVAPETARALLAALQSGFQPFEARGVGLHLWHYLGGPWRLDRTVRFGK